MPGTNPIDEIFAQDRFKPPAERCLPWIENWDGIAVVVKPKPHWAADLRVFRLDRREYCGYAEWSSDGGRARSYSHIDTSGGDVMQSARAMIAREIAEGLWNTAQ